MDNFVYLVVILFLSFSLSIRYALKKCEETQATRIQNKKLSVNLNELKHAISSNFIIFLIYSSNKVYENVKHKHLTSNQVYGLIITHRL